MALDRPRCQAHRLPRTDLQLGVGQGHGMPEWCTHALQVVQQVLETGERDRPVSTTTSDGCQGFVTTSHSGTHAKAAGWLGRSVALGRRVDGLGHCVGDLPGPIPSAGQMHIPTWFRAGSTIHRRPRCGAGTKPADYTLRCWSTVSPDSSRSIWPREGLWCIRRGTGCR